MSGTNGTLWRIEPRYEKLTLGAPYEGVWARMLVNAPQRVAEQLSNDLVGSIVQLVQEWNLADGDGQPVEITRRGVAEVPSDILLLLVRRWNEARMLPLTQGAS